MSSLSRELVTQCRLALQLTQQQFGEMLGYTKRTVQRWEDRGALLLPSQAQVLATALRPGHPELATQVAASMGMTLDDVLRPLPVDAAAPVDPIESIVLAAAEALGISPEDARPGVAAAFDRARQLQVDIDMVAELLLQARG